MNTHHTPGPWHRACNGADKIQIVVCESKRFPDEPSGLVAEVNKRISFIAGSDPMKSPEAEANARLIAAAPELLDILKEIIIQEVDSAKHGIYGIASSLVAQAQDAIAKATESPSGDTQP